MRIEHTQSWRYLHVTYAPTQIDIDALPACGWMHMHKWVSSLNWLAADGQPHCACASHLCNGTVHSGQTLDLSLETGAEQEVE